MCDGGNVFLGVEMRFSDFVCVDAIVADLEAEDRDGVIREQIGRAHV